MNRSETATLLGLCAAYDRRTTGDADVLAWADILGDLRLEDCVHAVKGWYMGSSTFIMPSNIREAVKKIRSERIASGPYLLPPSELNDDPVAQIAWLKDSRRRVADGEHIPERVELRQRRMPVLENVFRAVPHE